MAKLSASALHHLNYDQERAQNVVLQNLKLKLEIRQLNRVLIPIEEISHLGSELGSAIRTVVSRLHRTAPSLVGHPVEVIETHLKGEEDEILKQLNTLSEKVKQWETTASA